MFINVLNKKTCQNQDLFLSYLFFCLVRYVPVFPSQNFQCRLKKGVRYNLSAIKSFPKKVSTTERCPLDRTSAIWTFRFRVCSHGLHSNTLSQKFGNSYSVVFLVVLCSFCTCLLLRLGRFD